MEQSGPLVKSVWQRAINNIALDQCSNVLILGLGCGTAARIISQKYPHAKITGVEIDPIMIDIGKKYFALDKIPNLKILVKDARHFRSIGRFDLVLVDIYVGAKQVRISRLKKFLAPTGQILVNCLRLKEGYINLVEVCH